MNKHKPKHDETPKYLTPPVPKDDPPVKVEPRKFEQQAMALPCSGCDGQLKLVDKVSGLCMKHHPLT